MYALAAAGGEVVWQNKRAGSVWGRISVANGVGFVGNDNVLTGFDVDSGEQLFRYETHGTIAGVTTIANGRVAFGEGMAWRDSTSGSMLTVLTVP